MELVGQGVGTQVAPRPSATGNSSRATLSQARARQRLSAPTGVVGIAAGGAAGGAVRKVLNYAHKEGRDGGSGPE